MKMEVEDTRECIAITGAFGFIGSCLAAQLSRTSVYKLILIDDFREEHKLHNLENVDADLKIEREDFLDWTKSNLDQKIDYFLHIGARTDTTEFDKELFDKLNLNYSKAIWNLCCERNIPLIYASSAATYGNGENGYSDDHNSIHKLVPLNPYGESKNDFDLWVLKQKTSPPFWYGLKFFNVYGPNEFHKSRMASVIFHAFSQFKDHGSVKLFKSHKAEFNDGEQLRDFVYVKDVVAVIYWLLKCKTYSGIYNLGTGKANTFYALAASVASAMQVPLNIQWIDIPEDIRDKYQYFTEAKMDKLIAAGFKNYFTTLEAGIEDYVKNYLIPENYY